ncbi:MAG: archaeoflavoprotein AfpA [Candidatus Thorarchaeota archaeon]|nr:MAG: archaeoflavoprotein AfpA [Candidatus Thorarchaeota archaeon]
MTELVRIAWGITGSGDKIRDVIETMTRVQEDIGARVDVFVSKAGRQVLHWYKLWNLLNESFTKVKTEVDANTPFIAGPLQVGEYDALVVAPLTANSASKIAYGIADTLITNAVAQALKGNTRVILFPVDQHPGETETMSPEGMLVKIRTRRVDLENSERLRKMEGVRVVGSVTELAEQIKALMMTS